MPLVKYLIFFLLLVSCQLYAFASPLLGKEFQALEKDGVRVLYEGNAGEVASQFLEVYPAVTSELEKIIGWSLDIKSTVVLFSDSDRFKKAAGSPHIVAFALPSKGLIAIDLSRLRNPSFEPRHTLKHEVCHLLMHEHISRVHLPKWLDEGVCQWVSGGFTDILMEQKQSRLNRAILSGRIIPLGMLAKHFPPDGEGMQLAYEESKSFVEYIISRFGKQGLLSLLARMEEGEEVDSALLKALGVPFRPLENQWREYLRQKVTWFTYLSYHIYDILFGLMALLLVAASLRVLFRKRAAYKEEMDSLDE